MKKVFNYILFCGVTLFLGTNSIFAAKQCVYCAGDSLGIPVGIPNFISALINMAKILVPIILIVSAMIRYAKVVMSGEDKTAKEVNQSFIRSIISAVFIFIIVSVVQTVFTLVGDEGKSSLACISCFIGGDCSNITSTCQERDTGICSNKNEEQCNEDNNICEWKNGKCTEIGSSPSGTSCLDITSQGLCHGVDSSGNACIWNETYNSCQINSEAKSCSDYISAETCPESDNFGHSCKWTSEGQYNGIPKCVENGNGKHCSDYEENSCPEVDSYGYLCERSMTYRGYYQCTYK